MGFQNRIDINIVIKEDIINGESRMISVLKENNFTFLHEKSGTHGNQSIQYHIHDKTFEDILNTDKDEIIYVCNHDCN